MSIPVGIAIVRPIKKIGIKSGKSSIKVIAATIVQNKFIILL